MSGYRLIVERALLYSAPRFDAPQVSELLYGEEFSIISQDDEGWCHGVSRRDNYSGYIAKDLLAKRAAPTHKVTAVRSFAYLQANIKTPPIMALSHGALLEIVKDSGDFSYDRQGFFVWSQHLAPLTVAAADFVTIAESLLGTPYLWGGRSSLGLDCSGLVQLALQSCGYQPPRDSHQQEQALGELVAPPLQRGDLVFWRGHVGIMQNSHEIIHANGFSMQVSSEPLAGCMARLGANGTGQITSIKRLSRLKI